MSGTTITVKPGAPQWISGATFAQGSTIYNLDDTNAVWLSSVQAVSPGNGIIVPALGSIEWTGKSNPWACVDTGVTDPVDLMVSDDGNNLQNPLAIAIATATELINNGVPSSLILDYLGTITPSAGITPDVHKYNSLLLVGRFSSNIGSPQYTVNVNIYAYPYPATNSNAILRDNVVVASQEPTSIVNTPNLQPVLVSCLGSGSYLYPNEAWNAAFSVDVFGTNRVIQSGHIERYGFESSGLIMDTGNTAWTSGQTSFLGGATSIGGFFQGPCSLSMQVSGSTLTGYLGFQIKGTNVYTPILDSSGLTAGTNGSRWGTIMTAFPANLTNIYFQPEATVATARVMVVATPAY